ncbi:MAG TPA: alpha/beta hydrolase, partial [Rhodocyclaceae bacterium]|nr:alpha/beta hydrolase [Rhodocyclaceae bacterium]HNC79326.1 alpha/beta hydrolase [Rhodocyclaceae bacterium]
VAWAAYERALAEPEAPPQADLDAAAAECLVRKYRVQAHYLQAGAFVTEAGFLDACASLPGVPVTLIHGRLDRVCPPDNARRVHARIPGSRLVWVDGCGHAAFHPGMVAAWRQALGGAG